MPSVTIVMPTWNGARFLRPQLDSILAQTHRDWLMLAVDDGSTDDTRAILAEHAASDPRIQVLATEGNLGQRRRLEQALEQVETDLVAISDQDDVWAEDKLARLIVGLGDRDLSFGLSVLIDERGERLGYTLTDNFPPAPNADDRVSYLFRPSVSAHAMVARREVLTRESLRGTVPFDWAQSLDAAFRNGVRFDPDAVTFHRMHGGNQMNGVHADWRNVSRGSLKPSALKRHYLRNQPAERFALLQRVGHLAGSTAIDLALAGEFRKLYETCRRAWFDEWRAPLWNDLALAERFWSVVDPFCGQKERPYVRSRVEALFQSPFHPNRLVQHRKGVLRP